MKQVTTYVGIDAHKKDLFVAMLIGRPGDAGDVAAGQRAEARCGGWCASSSAKRRAPCTSSTKPARAATRCSGR